MTNGETHASTRSEQAEIRQAVPPEHLTYQAHQHRATADTRRWPPVIAWLKRLWADFCNTMDRLEEEAGLKNQRKK